MIATVGDRSDVDAVRLSLVDPLDVARRLGIDKGHRRQGSGGILVVCPAHGDNGPSCSITVGADRTLRVKCFGCDFSGDVFGLIGAVERLTLPRDFRTAVALGAELARVALSEPVRFVAPDAPPPVDAETFAAMAEELLGASPLRGDVAAYLDGRRLLEDATRDGWGALSPPREQGRTFALLRRRFGVANVERSGLVKRGAFSHPDARVLIPWRGADGRIVTLQRRRIDGGEPKYVVPAGRSTREPYGADRLAADPRAPVAVVEGAIDVLALRALCRRKGVVCIPLGVQGVSSWRASWGALARGRRAFTATDADEAGERCASAIARDLTEGGALSVRRWVPPGANDWADVLAAWPPARRAG